MLTLPLDPLVQPRAGLNARAQVCVCVGCVAAPLLYVLTLDVGYRHVLRPSERGLGTSAVVVSLSLAWPREKAYTTQKQ